jgi:broad specificity phosphatase PhoE
MLLYCIRHGESFHNVDCMLNGKDAYFDSKNIDPHLTENGVIQATRMYNNWKVRKNIELVLVSPLFRTLETAECIFGKCPSMPVVALDLLLESPQGSHLPNYRSCKSDLVQQYPYFMFDTLNEYQENYECEETQEELTQRIDNFKRYIINNFSHYSQIAVVGHNSIFKSLFKTTNKIEHCDPMPFELTKD